MEKTKRMLIGMPCASGQVPTIMLRSLVNLEKPMEFVFATVDRIRIDIARNELAKKMLREEFDYLFFVDDDNPIPADTISKFLEDDKDIVVAPIIRRRKDVNGNFPLCAFYAEEWDIDGRKLRMYTSIQDFKEEGYLHKIDAAGTGCMLIKRKVLEALEGKYGYKIFDFDDIIFKTPITKDNVIYDCRRMGEDGVFSERAVDAGFEIWLDERIRPIHIHDINCLQWSNPKGNYSV